MTKTDYVEKVKKEMKENGTYNKKAVFQCFADGIFTYHIKAETFITEINIISDDMFFAKEKPKDLFDKKRIGFLEVSSYDLNDNFIKGKTYRPLGECEMN